MLEPIAQALERQDYRTAAQLLKPLIQQNPKDPWVQFYVARVHEGTNQAEKAETLYRKLLKVSTNPKLIKQAREGLLRLEAREREARQRAIAQATTDSQRTGLGGLILEPLSNEAKTAVVPAFARLMQLEAYTARLLLPSRNWRFYRTGKIGELEVYAQSLREIGVPAFCVALADVARIPVIQARDLKRLGDRWVIPQLASETAANFEFFPREVRACVEGALPWFESVIDRGPSSKTPIVRKEQVKDYTKMLDLHLSAQVIVRFCDRTYHYPRDPDSLDSRYATTPQLWSQFKQSIQPQVPEIVGSDRFVSFADTVLEQEEFLRQISAQIELSTADALISRDDAPPWHQAFHLYSSCFTIKDGFCDRPYAP